MANFDYYNVNFYKAEDGRHIMVRGEIKNNSGRNYSAVAIRVIFYNKNIAMINAIVVVNGLPNGISKSFEKYIEEIEFEQVAKLINRCEVHTESAY